MIKSNNADAFEMQYRMMKITGAWPSESPTVLYKIKGGVVYIISLILGATMLIETYNDLNDLVKLSEILYIMVMMFSYILKHASVFSKRTSFIEMIKLLKDPIFLSYPNDLDCLMVERIRVSSSLANCYRSLVFFGCLMLGLYPFLDQKPLPFPFPFDLGTYRPVMFVFQIVGVTSGAWNNVCLDSLAVNLMGIAATHLEILSVKLIRLRGTFETDDTQNELSKQTEDVIITRNLRQIVQHHLAVMKLTDYIEKVFSLSILFQFIGSVIIICNTVFHIALVSVGSSQFLTLINYLVNIVLQLFMYCWFGNEIVLKSKNVGQACYTFPWYSSNQEIRKCMLLIMERAQRPLRITAYNFSSLTIRAFSSIIQWSYSYYALLMKMYRKKNTLKA